MSDLKVQKGKVVIISLQSNPSTGYGWIPKFDPQFIRLVKKEFNPLSSLLGAGGIEKFEFKALASGVTTLRMMYKRDGR
jgi:predicted secreted protein